MAGINVEINLRPTLQKVAGQENINRLSDGLNDVATQLALALEDWTRFNNIPFDTKNISSVEDLERALAKAGITIKATSEGLVAMARSADGMSHSFSSMYGGSSVGFTGTGWTDSARRNDQIKQLTEYWKAVIPYAKKLNSLIGEEGSQASKVAADGFEKLNDRLQQYRQEIDIYSQDENSLLAIFDRQFNYQMQSIEADRELTQTKRRRQEITEAFNQQEQEAIKTASEYVSVIKQLTQAELEYNQLKNQYGKNPSASQQEVLTVAGNRISDLRNRSKLLEENVRRNIELGAAEQKGNEALRQGSDIIAKFQLDLKKQNAELRQSTSLFSDFGSQFKQTFKMVTQSGLSWKIFSFLSQSLRQAIKNATELDKVLVDLQIASGKSKESAQELLQTYNQMAKELGSTTQKVAESATEWLRQGYSISETNELIKDSMVLSKVGAIEAGDATKYLTSAIKGYKLEATDALGIVDMLTAVDLKAAVSSGELAEGMSQTANLARTTGFEMNQLIGVIATVAETTQNSASSVGNAMKTVFSRMSNVKAGVDTDEDGGSLKFWAFAA